jgi:hypothetical protein
VLIGGGTLIESRVRALIQVLKQAVPEHRKACRRCGGSKGEPALLDGEVEWLCPSCIEGLEHESEVAQNDYDTHPANVPLALAAALVAGAAGAALYGGVMIATDKMLWLIAILTGSGVGFAAVKGAGKATAAIQAMAAGITVLSVLAGLLVFMGYLLDQQAKAQGGGVDWLAFLQAAPRLLIAGGKATLFSLGGGVIGAWSAARWVSPPDFTVVEKGR